MKNIKENELKKYILKKLQESYFDEFEFDKDAMKAAMSDIESDSTAGEFEELGSSKFKKDPKFKEKFKTSLNRANLELTSDEEEVEHYAELLKQRKAQEDRFGKGSLNEDEFDVETGRIRDSKGNPIKLKSQVKDIETGIIGYVDRFMQDHDTLDMLVKVNWINRYELNIANIIEPEKLIVTGGELRELNKSTYNKAAAKAVEKDDNKLAINFLKHSNEMGIEDDVQGNDYHDRANRYMFFSNLEQIRRQTGLLLDMDEDQLNSILEDGHDWAQDHIATAKESIDQVFDFLMNETSDGDMFNSTNLEDKDEFEDEIEEGSGRSHTIGRGANKKPVDYPEDLMREAVKEAIQEVFSQYTSTSNKSSKFGSNSSNSDSEFEKNLNSGVKLQDVISAVKNVITRKGNIKGELEKLQMKNWKGTPEGWHEFITNKKYFSGTNEGLEKDLGKYYVPDSDFNKANYPDLAGKFFKNEPSKGVEFEEVGKEEEKEIEENISNSLTNKKGKNAKPKASHLKEGLKEDRYEEVIYLQDHEADHALNILKQDGKDDAMDYLMQWHEPGNHESSNELGTGTSDRIYKKNGYIMYWNPSLGYIGLVYDEKPEIK
jgi:hypothetical protein